MRDLLPASFKGFRFPVDAEATPVLGRKSVIHDFPNSGKRFVQDLGVIPAEFTVSGIIHGPNYIQDSEQFKSILDSQGVGQLVLPHLGAFDVVALPYSVEYNHKTIGVVRFSLKFSISNADEVPAQSLASKETVFQGGDEARIFMQENFEDNYEIPQSETSFLSGANDIRRTVVDTVEKYSSVIENTNGQLQKIVRDIQSDIVSLTYDPIGLANKLIYGNINLVNGLYSTVSSLFSGEDEELASKPTAAQALKLATFGDDFNDNSIEFNDAGIALWPADTGDRVARNISRELLVETVRINALVLGFESAANFDYETSDEITSTIVSLEETYSRIILSGGTLANNNDFKLLLDSLRASAYEVLNQKLEQVFSTGTFIVGGTQSITGLTFKLYAEDLENSTSLEELIDNLITLNPNQNPLLFNGTTNIFEDA